MHYNFLNQTYIHWICWSTEKEIIHTTDTAFYLPFIPKNLFICYQHKVVNPSFVGKLGYSDNQWDNCIVLIIRILGFECKLLDRNEIRYDHTYSFESLNMQCHCKQVMSITCFCLSNV